MAINESVQNVLAQHNWKQRTLVEVANAGQLFLITEAEFDRILEAEQLDEGVKEMLAKARQFASKLPANLQQAQQYVAKQTGKALDASNTAYVKAQNLINKIPLIGRIPETTRNRLLLGLALSLGAGYAASEMGADGGGGLAAADPGDAAQGATDAAQAAPDAAQAATDAAQPAAPAAPAAPAPQTTDNSGGGVDSTTTKAQVNGGTQTTTVTQGTPDPHAQGIVFGKEGNTTFVNMMKDSPTGDFSALRNQFHAVTDRMATGDVQGAKQMAAELANKMNLTPEHKQELMQLLMKVGQAAKAGGVKMR
jgi:hypothetical protein